MPRKTPILPPDPDPSYHHLTFAVLRALRGLSPTAVSRGAEEAGHSVSPSTIRRWRIPPAKGGTRYPQAAKLDAALSAVNCKLTVTKN